MYSQIDDQLASRLTVSSQVATFQVPPEPFKNHLGTCGYLIDPRNKPQEKQTEEPLAPIHA